MIKKTLFLSFLLFAVVFGAGCIAEANDLEGVYKFSSGKVNMNGEILDVVIGNSVQGVLITEDHVVIELRDGKYAYTSFYSTKPIVGDWNGETTFEIPVKEGETLVVKLQSGQAETSYVSDAFSQTNILKKV